MRIVKINDKSYIGQRLSAIKDYILKALQGGPVEITVQRPSKTREMESKYHAMIADISKQTDLDGKKYGVETWKAWLVDEFQEEMKRQGTPLSHPGRVIPSLDGQRVVSIRASTKSFRVFEASQFIEFLYSQGTEFGVRWSEPVMKYYTQNQK